MKFVMYQQQMRIDFKSGRATARPYEIKYGGSMTIITAANQRRLTV